MSSRAETKQMVAIVAGSTAGLVCFIGLAILMHRRFLDPRIRRTSTFSDNAILIILFVQLSIGLITVPFSLSHSDANVMLRLSAWAQGILTFRPGVGPHADRREPEWAAPILGGQAGPRAPGMESLAIEMVQGTENIKTGPGQAGVLDRSSSPERVAAGSPSVEACARATWATTAPASCA